MPKKISSSTPFPEPSENKSTVPDETKMVDSSKMSVKSAPKAVKKPKKVKEVSVVAHPSVNDVSADDKSDLNNIEVLSHANVPAQIQEQKVPLGLKPLERLIGTWNIKGRTDQSNRDDITGQVVVSWLVPNAVMEMRGSLSFGSNKMQSLEVITYDAEMTEYPSYVYSSINSAPSEFFWDIEGDTVTHWTDGSKYTGTFEQGGKVLTGGWQLFNSAGQIIPGGYRAVMTKIN